MNYGQTRPKDIDWNGETKFYRQPMKSEFLYQQSQFTPPYGKYWLSIPVFSNCVETSRLHLQTFLGTFGKLTKPFGLALNRTIDLLLFVSLLFQFFNVFLIVFI